MHAKLNRSLCLLMCALILAACGKDKHKTEESGTSAKATQITVAKVATQALGVYEEAVGSLEGVIDPTIAAETSARVLKVLVHPGQAVKKGQTVAVLDNTDIALQRNEAMSEVARIEALLSNQNKVVERNRALVDKNFISKNVLDDAASQQDALKQQLAGAKSRIASINHNGSKSHVIAPANGVVEKQIVSEGDFVRVGDPIVQIISTKLLRAHLPFPESAAVTLKPGLSIELRTPTSDKMVTSTIRELKPQIVSSSRSIDVIADVRDEADWQPGASVTGRVVLNTHTSALTVPEQSLVLRPAGEVVYEIKNNIAIQRIVKSGLVQNGQVEILQGLQGNELVAVDGAAFLTDQAKISIIKADATQADAAQDSRVEDNQTQDNQAPSQARKARP